MYIHRRHCLLTSQINSFILSPSIQILYRKNEYFFENQKGNNIVAESRRKKQNPVKALEFEII